jgi:hypothetical protein
MGFPVMVLCLHISVTNSVHSPLYPLLPSPQLLSRSLIVPLLLQGILSFSFCIWQKTCETCISVLNLFHSMWCPPIPPIFLQITGFNFSLWMNNTPRCLHHIFFTIHLGWSYTLAIVNSSTINVALPSAICPGVV